MINTLQSLFFFFLSVRGSFPIHEIMTSRATLLPRESPKWFEFPRGHPLKDTSHDYSTIHPRDTLYLSMDAGDSSYFLVLKPNIDFVNEAIHEEVASNNYSDDHPISQLSKMKTYEGDVFFTGDAGSSPLMSEHKESSFDNTVPLGTAKVIFFEDGEYQPVTSTTDPLQHTFLNPSLYGSIFIGDDMFVLNSAAALFSSGNHSNVHQPSSKKLVLVKRDHIENESSGMPTQWCPVSKRQRLIKRRRRRRRKNSNRNTDSHPQPNDSGKNSWRNTNSQSQPKNRNPGLKVADIAIAVDCHYYAKYGRGVIPHLAELYTTVSHIYETNFNIKIRVGQAFIEQQCGKYEWNVASCDGYSIEKGLHIFKKWLDNTRGQENTGIAHSNLLTGCKGDGPAGFGDVSVLCKRNGGSVTTIQSNEFNVVAHEMGHGFGANHDCSGPECCQCSDSDCTIDTSQTFLMNPVSNTLKEFSPCTKQEIRKTIASSGHCLREPRNNEEPNWKDYFKQWNPNRNDQNNNGQENPNRNDQNNFKVHTDKDNRGVGKNVQLVDQYGNILQPGDLPDDLLGYIYEHFNENN